MITKQKYCGSVYCVTVPNHTIYVEKNGIPCWCGNSNPGGLSQFQTAFGPRFAQIDFDKKILEIDARCKEIEDDFFPIKRNVAMGFI